MSKPALDPAPVPGTSPVPSHPPESARTPPIRTWLEELLGRGARRPGERRLRRVLDAVDEYGLAVLARWPAPELAERCGVSAREATRLAAAFALGRDVERSRVRAGPLLGRPEAVARLMAPELRGLEVETFHVLLLDARHRLRARRTVAQGTLSSAPVHPREVFAPALRLAAAGVIVVHNHPSGDPEPSTADLDVTRRIEASGGLVGVPLLDHIVWAHGAWVSLRERGHLRGP